MTTVDDRGRSYRGVLEATGGTGLRLVNLVGVEDYLRGMAEVPGTWPPAAVQAQTVAARTYALRAMRAGGELCDDARCQVYVGRGAESRGQDAAVYTTASKVLTHGGALAAAVYSADAGGVSATTLEGFGTPDGVYPYLTTVRYETDNPLPWHLEVSLADVGARLGYRGTLSGVRVEQTGPSGRALSMVLEGSAGAVPVEGIRFARALGLRSTRFTASLGSSALAPPPPPMAEEALQALPDDAAAMARQPQRPFAPERTDRRSAHLTSWADASSPLGLDARRGVVFLALVLVTGAAATHLPLAMAGHSGWGGLVDRLGRVRPWARWRPRPRNR